MINKLCDLGHCRDEARPEVIGVPPVLDILHLRGHGEKEGACFENQLCYTRPSVVVPHFTRGLISAALNLSDDAGVDNGLWVRP